MTYKQRQYISEAWKRNQKRKNKKFIKEFSIALFILITGTILGVYIGLYFEHTSITQSLINVRIMIFGG